MNCLLENNKLFLQTEAGLSLEELKAKALAAMRANKSNQASSTPAEVETPPVNLELLNKLQQSKDHAPTDPARKMYEIPRASSKRGKQMSKQLPVTSAGTKDANKKMYLTKKLEELNEYLPNWDNGRWAIYKALKGTIYFDRLPGGYDPDDKYAGKPPVFVLAMDQGGSAQNIWQGATDDPTKHDADQETLRAIGKIKPEDLEAKHNFSSKELWRHQEVVIDDPEFVEKLIPEIHRISQGLSKEDIERQRLDRKISNNPVRNKNYVETIANYAIQGFKPSKTDPTKKQIVVNKETLPVVVRAIKFEKELDDPNLVGKEMKIRDVARVLSSKSLKGGTKEFDDFLNIVSAMFSGDQDVTEMPDPLEYRQLMAKFSPEELDLEAVNLLIRAAKKGGFPFLVLLDGETDDPLPFNKVKIFARGIEEDDPLKSTRTGLSSMSHEDMAAAKSNQMSSKSMLDKAQEILARKNQLPKKEATEWIDVLNIMENFMR